MITRSEARRAQRELANTNTNLLHLPAELRNHIYTYLLPDWSEYRVGGGPLIRSEILRPSILRTSRQLRKEAASIFYGKAHFILLPTGPVFFHGRAWLHALPADALALIRRFSFDAFVRFDYQAGAMNDVGVMAHKLKITIERHTTGFRCVSICNGSCGKGVSICPAMAVISTQAATALERLRTACDKGEAFQKEDLLEQAGVLHEYGKGVRTS